jgi:hypothetical protein
MFRVSKTEERSRTVIVLDGQLMGDYVEAIEACCCQAISSGKPVHLFLRDISTVDESGCAMLRRLAAKGVSVFASGVYTSYLVQSLVASGADPSNASPNATAPADETKWQKP